MLQAGAEEEVVAAVVELSLVEGEEKLQHPILISPQTRWPIH